MSSFYCDKCGALCSDTERGYVSGCKHYPADISAVEYQRRMDKIIAKGGAVNETLIALLDEASRFTIASGVTKRVTNDKPKLSNLHSNKPNVKVRNRKVIGKQKSVIGKDKTISTKRRKVAKSYFTQNWN